MAETSKLIVSANEMKSGFKKSTLIAIGHTCVDSYMWRGPTAALGTGAFGRTIGTLAFPCDVIRLSGEASKLIVSVIEIKAG